MSVNEAAPVIATGEIEVAVAPETAWHVMTDIDHWPTWNPDVKQASLHGGVAEGNLFRWRVRTGKITSTFTHVERAQLLAWTGKGFGVNAVHVWRLEPRDGKTVVRTEESWEGLLARVLRAPFRKALQRSIDSGLIHLKAEAERRAKAG